MELHRRVVRSSASDFKRVRWFAEWGADIYGLHSANVITLHSQHFDTHQSKTQQRQPICILVSVGTCTKQITTGFRFRHLGKAKDARKNRFSKKPDKGNIGASIGTIKFNNYYKFWLLFFLFSFLKLFWQGR